MIEQVFDAEELSAIASADTAANKVRALALAYGTEYGFCRFFRQGTAYLSVLDKSAVLCGAVADFEELAQFLLINGFSELFCTTAAAQGLCREVDFSRADVNLMTFAGSLKPLEFDFSPPLRQVYDILKTGFDVPFGPWYLDMSHRVRHGVSRVAVLDGSCLCVQHELCGEALLSQIATLPELRRQGRAQRLIRAVCARLTGEQVRLLCEDALVGFYENVGFVRSGAFSILSPRM